MTNLNTEQLESIQRLLVEPLRETVKTEIQLSYDHLVAAIERVDERLVSHIDRTEKRLSAVERETGRLRAFRHRVAAVYGVLAVALSLAWSMLRDKLMGKWSGR